MIKIVSNIKKRLAVFLLSALLIGQGSGYLAQKLMVENNIRERIKDALPRLLTVISMLLKAYLIF